MYEGYLREYYTLSIKFRLYLSQTQPKVDWNQLWVESDQDDYMHFVEKRPSQCNILIWLFKNEIKEFTNISLDTEAPLKKKKVPRRLIHCSDGVLEEYSTDEEEDTPPPPPPVDPVCTWTVYIVYLLIYILFYLCVFNFYNVFKLGLTSYTRNMIRFAAK